MGFTQPQLLGYILYAGALSLIAIGIFVIISRQNIIRILLGLGMLESGVNLVLIIAGFRMNAVAPIYTSSIKPGTAMVDPVPQALILTTIVIGVGILALALAISVELHRKYGTLNVRKLLAISEQETSAPKPQIESDPTTGQSPVTSGDQP